MVVIDYQSLNPITLVLIHRANLYLILYPRTFLHRLVLQQCEFSLSCMMVLSNSISQYASYCDNNDKFSICKTRIVHVSASTITT